ncbi:MAG: cation-transporting P-type ATPase [Alphaproteobacteria bacterium]|nr:cation-transporting P-type ATPase [Alphaproteobacteria bacterium]
MAVLQPNNIPESGSARPPGEQPWHAVSVDAAMESRGGKPSGLTAKEARERLAEYGPNRLPPPKSRSAIVRFLAQFNNVLLYVLVGAAVVTALLGHWIDTGVIVGVVIINAIVGFIQEGKAEKALEAIHDMLSPQARVRRGDRSLTVPAETLVPGDIVLLQSGDRVPADLRLLETKSLQIQESALTGESEAVEKATEPVARETELGDRTPMAYAGTLVTYGKGIGVAVETANRTEIGRISSMLTEVQTLPTPLLRQIAVFSRWLTLAILVIAAATFVFGLLVYSYSLNDMFMAAVGLAVAAIPEGLPAVMTITLAIGVTRMARRNAIIRRLPAVETLGSVTVICSDKTGTLTHNELMVQTVLTAEHVYTVTGSGYEPIGEFRIDDEPVTASQYPDLAAAAQATILCNDAELTELEGSWHLHGNPTDGALLTVGMKAKLDVAFERRSQPRTDLIPFESVHKFMATLHHDHEGHGYIYVKGAPERILEMCALQRSNGEDVPLDIDYWLERIEALASKAQRVIAIAWRSTEPSHLQLRFNDIETGLTLIAMFGLIDPPRSDAIEAVSKCQNAGIQVKMITGDHATTARAVAAHFGLGKDHRVLTGKELDALSEDEFVAVANDADIFARTTPEHKLRLVRALQTTGHVVAMTGDGVNDAPALKRADIGIAMGRKGTEAAKEAAEMVLTDDNFASIMHAVEEGRTVFDNLKKSILVLLPTSIGEALTILAAVLLAQALPITPVQILWINMITAVTLGMALAFEPTEAGVMERPPRSPDAPILSAFLTWRIVFVSMLLLVGTFGLFKLELAFGASLDAARTVAVNTLVAGEIVYLFNCRRITEKSWTRDGLFGSRPVLIAVALVIGFQLLFTYLPVMQVLFHTTPIDFEAWARIILFALCLFILVELEKAATRRYRSRLT